MATEPAGRVITFYSYKGGTGRSMALANVACVLAQRQSDGRGVLMVDWDLEAPGLHRYFRTRFTRRFGGVDDCALDEHPGLIDLFSELEQATKQANGDQEPQSEEDADALLRVTDLSRFILETDIPGLSLLKAGRFDDGYSTRVNTFQWEMFYRRSPWLLRIFAEYLAEQYRYVLIDSRTGFTDSSGICTMLLPEKLVVVFTPNRQSLTGVLDLIRRATNYRRYSDDLRPLVAFPLASRIEPTENTLRGYWRYGNAARDITGYQPQFEDVFREVYGFRECTLDAYFDEAFIQHVPAFAYGEEIAVLGGEGGDRVALTRRYESFTECLSNYLGPWKVNASRRVAATQPSGDAGQLLSELRPYPGLAPFGEADVRFFFGREEAIDRLLQRLRGERRFLAVLGPSGSGKSSLILAGLLPRLRQGAMPGSESWGIIVARPADHPLGQLEAQGLRGASGGLVEAVRQWLGRHPEQPGLVLILDQFEELFTICPEPLRHDFLTYFTQLLEAPLPLSVILVMRDDFYGRFVQQAPGLLEWLERGLINLPPTLGREELGAIIQGPATAVGLVFEPGLVDAIINDAIETAPAAEGEARVAHSTVLPLLQFALTQLWERRREGFLTHEAYNVVGGLTGGLAQSAEEVLASFSGPEQLLARRVFTGLVQVGDESRGVPDVRRRRSLAELCPQNEQPERVDQIVRRLADARMLVITDTQHGQATVEIVHEVLIHHWERLRRWLDEDREFLRWRQRLQAAVVEWERTEHDRGVLLRGSPLTEAKRWLTERANELTSAERGFIEESVALQLREAEVEQERQRRELAQARTLRLHRAVTIVGLVFALIIGVGVLAWLNAQRAKPGGELNNLTERLSSIRAAGDRAGEGRILTGIGAIHYSLGNYEKALEFFKRALAIQREIGDRAGEGSTLFNLGAIYYSLGNYEMASVLYGRALAIQEAIGDRAGEGRILTGIGAVYTKRGDYEKALEFFKRALAIQEAIGDRAGEGRILTGIGAIHYSLGNYEKALEFFKRALAIQREIGDRAGEGSTLSNLGAVYDSLGDNTRASTYYQQALEIQRAIGDQAKGQP